MNTNTQTFVPSARRQRVNNADLEMPVFPAPTPEKPKDARLLDIELGEHDTRFTAVLAGYTHKGRIIHLKAMIIVPMALHPVYREEALRQIVSFLDSFARTAQIAVHEFLDNHTLPPTTPDGKLALNMEVKLPSAASPHSPSPTAPQIAITAVAPAAAEPNGPYATTAPAFFDVRDSSC